MGVPTNGYPERDTTPLVQGWRKFFDGPERLPADGSLWLAVPKTTDYGELTEFSPLPICS